MVEELISNLGCSVYMNIAVCDDNRHFLETLERDLRKYAGVRDISLQIKTFQFSEALLSTDISSFDVVFLDIEMPGVNGLDVARQLREKSDDLIIVFITSFIEYAPAGYRVNAFRYLLKKSISQELWSCMDEIWEKAHSDAKLIEIQTRERTLEVAKHNILYFEGTTRRTVLMYLKQSKLPVECSGKLADYEDKLKPLGFLRLQNSFLANMDNIIKIRNYKAVLRNGVELKVSERRNAQVQKEFLAWRSHTI